MVGYHLSDYHKQAFTAAEVEYIIGTDSGTPFVAEEIVFFASQDVYVRFRAGGLQHRIPSGVYFEWYRRTGKLWIQRISSDGDLEIWAEGHTQQ